MRHYYGYQEFLEDCHSLTQQIDWEFDSIIGIARGGLTLSHLLGEYYDLREVYAINTIGYDGTTKLDHTEIFNIPDIKSATSVLIVDDIVDSGDTLSLVLETLSTRYPHVSFKSASLLYKESASIKPDWHAQKADRWIDFFWSDDLRDFGKSPLDSEV